MARMFNLESRRNWDARDELIVAVPIDRFAAIVGLIHRIGEDPDDWPWRDEEDRNSQIAVAAEALGVPAATLADAPDLLEALGVD